MPTYAIVEAKGKQYRVAAGDIINVDLLEAEAGDTVNLDKVLMVNADGNVTVGHPHVAGAHVVAQVESAVKGKKLLIFRYKPKTRERKKTGHRQSYSRLSIKSIEAPSLQLSPADGREGEKAAPRRRTAARKKAEEGSGDGA